MHIGWTADAKVVQTRRTVVRNFTCLRCGTAVKMGAGIAAKFRDFRLIEVGS